MTTIRRSDKVKILTLGLSVPNLIKSRLGQDPVDQEIRRYRDRFFFLQEHQRELVAAFQMLRPLLKNKTLQKRLHEEGKGKGASLMVGVLFQACILDCHTLLVDGDENNPSLCTLTRPFRKRKDNAKLLDRLASLYSDHQPPWLHPSNTSPFSPEEIAKWKRENQKENAGRRLAFWRIADRLHADWKRLEKAGKFIRPFRNDVSAHLTLELDEATDSYRFRELAPFVDLYNTIENILPITSRSVANLAALLVRGGDRLNLFKRIAKDDAAIFWDLNPHVASFSSFEHLSG
jgi:hypothetical protein